MENQTPQLPAYPSHLLPRPATPADVAQVAEFLSAARPAQPVSAADLERLEGLRLPGEVFRRTLLWQGSKLAGLWEVSVPRMDGHAGWLAVDLAVQEGQQGALAAVLLAHAEAFAQAQGAQVLVTRVREDRWEKPFFEAHGYAEHDRMWLSTLNLQTLDFGRFASAEAKASALGVQLRPLSELGPFDEAAQRHLYALMAALLRDVPSTTPVSVWPFEVWQRRYASKLEHPEGVWLAVAPGGEWVGLSELHLPITTRPGTLHNGLTGVLPAWRGHGLALALKLAAARAALGRGFTHARTSNHSINHFMLAINERLGFEREAAIVTLKKAVNPGP